MCLLKTPLIMQMSQVTWMIGASWGFLTVFFCSMMFPVWLILQLNANLQILNEFAPTSIKVPSSPSNSHVGHAGLWGIPPLLPRNACLQATVCAFDQPALRCLTDVAK